MLTRRKLLSLSYDTRRRKIVRLLYLWEKATEKSPPADRLPTLDTMKDILATLTEDPAGPDRMPALQAVLETQGGEASESEGVLTETFRWKLKVLRGVLEDELGLDFADWDMTLPGSRKLDGSVRETLPLSLYIDGIRSPFNLGSIFRGAECFGLREILIAPGSSLPTHPRAIRSSMGSIEVVPWRIAEYEEIQDCKDLFALELGGTSIDEFPFPPSGICIIGSEELGVHPALRGQAKKKRGIVSIPLFGSKASLNVSVASAILMREWTKAVRRS